MEGARKDEAKRVCVLKMGDNTLMDDRRALSQDGRCDIAALCFAMFRIVVCADEIAAT